MNSTAAPPTADAAPTQPARAHRLAAAIGRALRSADREIARAVCLMIELRREDPGALGGMPEHLVLGSLAGRTGTEARALSRAASVLAQMPAARDAFSRGALGSAAVRALVAAAKPLARSSLPALDAAVGSILDANPAADQDHLICLVEEAAWSLAPHEQVNAESSEIARGFLWAQPGLDGMGGSIYACADAASFATITAAIDAAAPRPVNPDTPGAHTRAQQRLQGPLALCEAGLGGGGDAGGMRPRPRIIATVDLATLREHHQRPAGRLLWGMPGRAGHLSEVAVEVLSCDAEVQAVLFEGARAIAVGERCRTVTDAARRAVAARDQGCRFPGCHAPVQWTDCHHVLRRPKGSNSTENLVSLCRRCHRRVHEHDWSLRALPDGVVEFARGRTRLQSAPRLRIRRE